MGLTAGWRPVRRALPHDLQAANVIRALADAGFLPSGEPGTYRRTGKMRIGPQAGKALPLKIVLDASMISAQYDARFVLFDTGDRLRLLDEIVVEATGDDGGVIA